MPFYNLPLLGEMLLTALPLWWPAPPDTQADIKKGHLLNPLLCVQRHKHFLPISEKPARGSREDPVTRVGGDTEANLKLLFWAHWTLILSPP